MFIINITVNSWVSDETQNEMFPKHVAWFEKYFHSGVFLMLGPYVDCDNHCGVIFAQAKNRDELQSIIEEDCYYPRLAQYEIREFLPKLIAKEFNQKIG